MTAPTSSQPPAIDAQQILDMNCAFAQTAIQICTWREIVHWLNASDLQRAQSFHVTKLFP